MSRPQQDDLSRLIDRVTELETLYTHLQRTIQQLDEVVIEQQNRLDTLLARVDRLVAQSASDRAVRGDAERPPGEDFALGE